MKTKTPNCKKVSKLNNKIHCKKKKEKLDFMIHNLILGMVYYLQLDKV